MSLWVSPYRNLLRGRRGQIDDLLGSGVGRRFYVDATLGNDGNDGRSRGNAWQTIPKVNGETFRPADRIRLKCGEMWIGTRLAASSSGIAGKKIFFDAYGSGALPIIDGAGDIGGFTANQQNYLTIRNLQFQNGTGACVNLGGGAGGGNNNLLDNCAILNAGTDNVFISGAAAVRHHIRMRNCIVHDATRFGVYVGHSGAGGPDSILIENSAVYDNGINVAADHGIYAEWCSNTTVRNNTCYGNAAGGLRHNNANTDLRFYGNRSYANATGIVSSGTGVLCYNNLLYGNARGIWLLAGGADTFYYHNSIVNNDNYGIWFNDGTNLLGITLKNNIVFQDVAVVGNNSFRPWAIAQEDDIINNIIDYNCTVKINGADATVARENDPGENFTWATWQAAGADVNGINSDPDFVVDYTDLHLLVSSLCRGAGAVGTGVTEDYDGVTRGSPPDIGAYEYVA